MIDRHLLARDYLAPIANSFWRWTSDGEVVEGTEGRTIAFLEEIIHVLDRLAPGGLPPFGGVVLLLAACRESWGEQRRSWDIGRITDLEGPSWISHLARKFLDTFAGLDRVAALPHELRAPVAVKAVLAEMVFEHCRDRRTPDESDHIVRAMRERLGREALAPRIQQCTLIEPLGDAVRTLFDGLARFDPESLRLRILTGLDRLVKPADLEVPPVERVRQLIRNLQADDELAGLGRLARDLMAVVHLPRAVSAPDELPVGGVSDIANRGPIDRLLVSELAHDDLTLSVRIALGEALYLRRESPPCTPPRQRLLLIDSGIRLWGVPRVFATAVALALAALADQRSEATTFRAQGESLQPVDLTSRDGLITQLYALDAAPHPGLAVPRFLAHARAHSGPADLILVTHEDVLADHEFRAALAPLADHSLFAAVVSRTGSLRLLSLTPAGQKVIRTATLSLDALLAPSPRELPGTPLVNPAHDPSLPVILSRQPFPLLLPHSLILDQVRVSEQHGAVALTHDGRLMHWRKPGQGGHQLTAVVPAGRMRWFDIQDSVARLEFEDPQHRRATVLFADLQTGECRSLGLDAAETGPVTVCALGDVLFRVFRGHVDGIGLSTGQRADPFTLPYGVAWHNDRFFRGSDGWYALGFDGLRPTLDKVKTDHAGFLVSMLFDRKGYDGPWAVTASGRVCSTADGRTIDFEHALGVPVVPLAASPDGGYVAVRSQHTPGASRPREAVLDLAAGTVMHTPGAKRTLHLLSIGRPIETRGLRRRFQGVSVDAAGRLLLISRLGNRLAISLDAAGQKLVLAQQQPESKANSPWLYASLDPAATVIDGPASERTFRPIAGAAGTRYTLKLAAWRGGSRAYLDSRGLLHLVSSDQSLPQISIVLCDGELAAWCSNGSMTGTAYFVGNQQTVPASVVLQLLRVFMLNLQW